MTTPPRAAEAIAGLIPRVDAATIAVLDALSRPDILCPSKAAATEILAGVRVLQTTTHELLVVLDRLGDLALTLDPQEHL